ncbi:MAG: hypothetical protein K8T90_01220 [Planctomycetes bacterium]|nr:hypothetical protein [Planctomycetota bacterium]
MLSPPRRRAVVVSGLALIAAAAIAVAVGRSDSDPIHAYGWGTVAKYRAWVPIARWVPGLRVPRTKTVHLGRESAWAVTENTPRLDARDGVTLSASCACRFTASELDVQDDITLRVWQVAADEPTVTIHAVDAAREQSVRLERPSPCGAVAVAPDRPILALPWSGDVVDLGIELREKQGTVMLRYKYDVPPWWSATARDSGGRSLALPRTAAPFGLLVDLEFGARLCPHGPWWEISAINAAAERKVLRFACPQQPTLPR